MLLDPRADKAAEEFHETADKAGGRRGCPFKLRIADRVVDRADDAEQDDEHGRCGNAGGQRRHIRRSELLRKSPCHDRIVNASAQKSERKARDHAAENDLVRPFKSLQCRDDDDVVDDVVRDHVDQAAYVAFRKERYQAFLFGFQDKFPPLRKNAFTAAAVRLRSALGPPDGPVLFFFRLTA